MNKRELNIQSMDDVGFEEELDRAAEEDEEAGVDCGRWDNGKLRRHCAKAGSEECDWHCPLRDEKADR